MVIDGGFHCERTSEIDPRPPLVFAVRLAILDAKQGSCLVQESMGFSEVAGHFFGMRQADEEVALLRSISTRTGVLQGFARQGLPFLKSALADVDMSEQMEDRAAGFRIGIRFQVGQAC